MAQYDPAIRQAYEAYNAGDYDAARALCTRVLTDQPRHGDALLIQGMVLAASGRTGASIAALCSAARMRRHDPNAWFQLATMLSPTDADAAAEAFRRGMVLSPEPGAIARECASHLYGGDPALALPFVEQALATAPDDPPLSLLMAKTLHDLRRLDEAEPYFRKALASRAEDPAYRWEYAMQLLLRGRFDKGWDYYDSRFAAYGWQVAQYPFPMPAWNGQPLDGRTLLVHGEQGLGDEIMFYSIVPELIQAAARVIVACSPTLADLVQYSFPQAIVKPFPRDPASVETWRRGAPPPPWTAELAPIDFQCPAGSLARYRRASMDDFLDPVPYLKAPPALSRRFERLLRTRIERYDRVLKIGLAWMGNPSTGRMGRNKSIPIEFLAEWGEIAGVRFVGLHTPEHASTAHRAPALRVVDLSGHLKSLGHTAALIANLDLVISVDTVTCHLAAAMGKETWVPLRVRADWRYLDTGRRCIWYPDMKLFRQEREGDWRPVIEAIGRSLADRRPAGAGG